MTTRAEVEEILVPLFYSDVAAKHGLSEDECRAVAVIVIDAYRQFAPPAPAAITDNTLTRDDVLLAAEAFAEGIKVQCDASKVTRMFAVLRKIERSAAAPAQPGGEYTMSPPVKDDITPQMVDTVRNVLWDQQGVIVSSDLAHLALLAAALTRIPEQAQPSGEATE